MAFDLITDSAELANVRRAFYNAACFIIGNEQHFQSHEIIIAASIIDAHLQFECFSEFGIFIPSFEMMIKETDISLKEYQGFEESCRFTRDKYSHIALSEKSKAFRIESNSDHKISIIEWFEAASQYLADEFEGEKQPSILGGIAKVILAKDLIHRYFSYIKREICDDVSLNAKLQDMKNFRVGQFL